MCSIYVYIYYTHISICVSIPCIHILHVCIFLEQMCITTFFIVFLDAICITEENVTALIIYLP